MIGKKILAAARNDQERMAAQAFLQRVSSYRDSVSQKKRMEEERARYEAEMGRQAKIQRARSECRSADPPPAASGTTAGKGSAERRPTSPGEGRVAAVACDGTVMDLTIEYLGERFVRRAENYFKVDYLTTRWKAPANFNPCMHLQGRQVRVEYFIAVGKPFAGELVSLEVLR
jgi:hypothetical protein